MQEDEEDEISETISETGAVNNLGSEVGDKEWATPIEQGPDGDIPACPLTIDEGPKRSDIPLNALSWRDESHPQWVRMRSVMDSGAAQSVAPPSMAPGVPIEESPGS